MITLLGLGASGLAETVSPTLQKEIDGFLLQSPKPSSSDVANFLKLYSNEPAGYQLPGTAPPRAQRNVAAQALIARGVATATIASALTFLNTSGGLSRNSIWGLLSLASAGACAYHGVKRNNGSIAWGAWWMLMGGIFPVFAPIVAIARKPGFAKPL
jgi:hypothetical protein